MTSKPTLGVGMVGYAFMGQAHSQAWRTVNAAFDLPYAIDMAAIAGRNKDNVAAAAEKFGWRSYETDWRSADRPRRHRPRRRLQPRRQPRRGRDRRAVGRQARAV